MFEQSRHSQRGFTLVELLVAMAVTIIVLAGALLMFKKMTDAGSMVTQRVEMQANARVALNSIARDLTQAGAGGYPFGGISLPAGQAERFARDTGGTSYLAPNTFAQNVLFPVYPANGAGPSVNGQANNDGITIVFVDNALVNGNFAAGPANWNTATTTTISASGDSVTFPVMPAPVVVLNPLVNDPVYGLKIGDLMWLSNINGSAVGEITSIVVGPPAVIGFAGGDTLNMNKPAPACTVVGNISALASSAPAACPLIAPLSYPTTKMLRIFMVSYYLQGLDANNNPLALGAAGAVDYRLMRQVNAQPPTPVAEHIVNLRFAYDLFNSVAGTEQSNVAAPGGSFGQIRNVYVTVTARSARQSASLQAASQQDFSYATLYTNVSPRNLSFQNIYK